MADTPVTLFTPSAEDWVEHWPRILALLQHGNNGRQMTVQALAREMKKTGFNASPKMYYDRMRKANIKINLNAEERIAIGKQLVTEYQNSLEPPNIDLGSLEKIIRHHPKDTPDALQELKVLKTIKAALERPSAGSSRVVNRDALASVPLPQTHLARFDASNESPPQPIDFDGNDGDGDDNDDISPSVLTTGEVVLHRELIEGLNTSTQQPNTNSWSEPFQRRSRGLRDPEFKSGPRERCEPPGAFSSRSYIPPSVSALKLDNLIFRTQVYYTAKIKSDGTDTNAAAQGQSKDFWSRVKTAMYLYKDGGYERAGPMVLEIQALIPGVCAVKSLSFLHELFSTLSRANTDVHPGVRNLILKQFAETLTQGDHLDNELSTICNILLQDWVSDQHMVTMLSVLIRLTKDNADPFHPELVRLHRSKIALLRRMHDFPNAKLSAIEAREMIEPLHGPYSESTRLIMSEQAYIFSARRMFKEALEIAEDVVQRAQIDEGAAYPSQRSVYHLEDVADIQKKMKKHHEAAASMDYALDHAHGTGPHKEAALHLEDKFEELKMSMEGMNLLANPRQQSRA